MPMTFDTYSICSYGCLYCFSAYQKDIGRSRGAYRSGMAREVDPDSVKRIFLNPGSSQFGAYVQARHPMQWGGLADQFDENERKRGVSLDLLRFFRQIRYPISFSTKAAWWSEDERYVECFRGNKDFHIKFSLVTLDESVARRVERGVPSPGDRLRAMARAASWGIGGVTLRLRPFILGISDHDYIQLIEAAAGAGADSISTEFFCLEGRSPVGKTKRYKTLSEVCGFDIESFYKEHSPQYGYMRLNRDIKRPYMDRMQEACARLGLRFYVSDAHFKERCANGSCCGLPVSWGYTRGQDCEALMIARAKGEVHWSDLDAHLGYAEFPWRMACAYNTGSAEKRAAYYNMSMRDYLRYQWNHPRSGGSPWKMFGGILRPTGLDGNGDVIYAWDGKKA